ncbi:MAG: hypothetical protein Q7S61_01010 [bacterium]|nr:hypothetical protein [bacterium]
MDLKRVSIGLYRKSFSVSDRFKIEALARIDELEVKTLPTYIQSVVRKTEKILKEDAVNTAEDILMYSIILQNYTVKYLLRN